MMQEQIAIYSSETKLKHLGLLTFPHPPPILASDVGFSLLGVCKLVAL